MRPSQSLVSLALGLSSLAAAALRPNFENNAVAADSSSSSGSISTDASASPTTDSSKSDPTPVPTKSSPDSSRTASDDADSDKSTASDKSDKKKPTATKKGGDEKTSTHTGFPPDAPPAGVNMLTPLPNLEPTPLYRIRDTVTWAWNYTSMLGTPTAIDVIISCSVAAQTWTLTSNMSFATSVTYTWDTNDQGNSVETPLLTERYTLIVKDSDVDFTAPPEPGYLGTAKNFFTFGLYTGIPYKPLSEWKCNTCSGAASLFDQQALGLAVVTSTLTILSFTWFVAGLNLH
ncbi:SSCRP protein [Ophiocordyceps camponoti-floridani]|uniref:SSCRP protein n=1 Tax=Ophiocordyceps camponoti-floridani TaxID=2030778 RepID=A0A8H4Q442_9HYPO|nr:SSCRP protein [Ophiocordyceps camponoti-floridani]